MYNKQAQAGNGGKKVRDATDTDPDNPKEVLFGSYLRRRRLGGGQASEVYLATNTLDQTLAVLKVLPQSVATPSNLAKYEREVSILQRLTSPHTVRMLDHGSTHWHEHYLITRYMGAANLYELTTRHGVFVDGRVVPILLQVCHSLSEVHGHGWLHGDLSPKNVALTAGDNFDDRACVIDFGSSLEMTSKCQDTSTRPVTGTPAFMSPEACGCGDELGPESDIYSLGCLAFYLLSGRLPFSGATSLEICWKQIHAERPKAIPASGNMLSCELEQLILSCLARQPGQRPTSMGELSAELQRCVPATDWHESSAKQWWAMQSN
jgi:serine/threonine-protein kinase